MKYFALLCLVGSAMAVALDNPMDSRFDSEAARPAATALRAAALKALMTGAPAEDISELRAAAAVASGPEVATIAAAALDVAAKEAAKNGVSSKDLNPLRAAAFQSFATSRSPMNFDRATKAATAAKIPTDLLEPIKDISSKNPWAKDAEATSAMKKAASAAKGVSPDTIARIRAAASEASAFGIAVSKFVALKAAHNDALAKKESAEKISALKKATEQAVADIVRTAIVPATAITRNADSVLKIAHGMAHAFGLEDLEASLAKMKKMGLESMMLNKA